MALFTHNQEHCTILEVTTDCLELMTPQHTMRQSIAHVSKQLDLWSAASRHTTAPISRTRLRKNFAFCSPLADIQEGSEHVHAADVDVLPQ